MQNTMCLTFYFLVYEFFLSTLSQKCALYIRRIFDWYTSHSSINCKLLIGRRSYPILPTILKNNKMQHVESESGLAPEHIKREKKEFISYFLLIKMWRLKKCNHFIALCAEFYDPAFYSFLSDALSPSRVLDWKFYCSLRIF